MYAAKALKNMTVISIKDALYHYCEILTIGCSGNSYRRVV